MPCATTWSPITGSVMLWSTVIAPLLDEPGAAATGLDDEAPGADDGADAEGAGAEDEEEGEDDVFGDEALPPQPDSPRARATAPTAAVGRILRMLTFP